MRCPSNVTVNAPLSNIFKFRIEGWAMAFPERNIPMPTIADLSSFFMILSSLVFLVMLRMKSNRVPKHFLWNKKQGPAHSKNDHLLPEHYHLLCGDYRIKK